MSYEDAVTTTVQTQAMLAGADFDVSYMPAGFIRQSNAWSAPEFYTPVYETGEYQGEPKQMYIVRDDTNEVVGLHSSKYPKREAYAHNFDVLEQAFPNTCESVKVWDNGGVALVTQKLGEPVELPMGDTVVQYVYTMMSLNGTKRTASIPKAQRISCSNQLGIHLAIISSKATRNHDARISFQAEVFDKSEVQLNNLVQQAHTLTRHSLTDKEFSDMVHKLVPEPDKDASTRAINTYKKTLGSMHQAWKMEVSEYGDRNLWVAYNAVQGAEQHRVNANFKWEDDKGYDAGQRKSIFRALEGETPLADACEQYLKEVVQERTNALV